jgi:hypothetical protein
MYISSAIFELERYTNLSIHPASWNWTPSELASCYTRWEAPKTPVRAVLDDQGTTIHAYDCHATADLTKQYISDLTPGSLYELVVGYDDINCLPASLLSAIKLLTGTLYENREAVQYGSLTMMPDIKARLQTLWLPAV